MLWSFKALGTFSLDTTKRINTAVTAQSTLHRNPPHDTLEHDTLAISVATPALEESSLEVQRWQCQCGYHQVDFCPYCDYEQGTQGSIIFDRSSSDIDIDRQDGSGEPIDVASRPRKLRKSKPDYQQLRYQLPPTEAVVSARPVSILSTHSRTPLLNATMNTNPNYLPLAVDRRTPNKLEKPGKRQRSISSEGQLRFLSDSPNLRPKRLRTVTSKAFLKAKNFHSFGPRPRGPTMSIDTNALTSLAWTGEMTAPMRSPEMALSSTSSQIYIGSNASSPSLGSRSPSFATSETPPIPRQRSSSSVSTSQNRRSMIRRARDSDYSTTPSRPWTLAMAITDDDITDEKLVDDLENMRIKEAPIAVSTSTPTDVYPLGLCPPPGYDTVLHDSYKEYPLQPGETELDEPESPSEASWTAARQVLLLCRELVRTERRYLSSLKTLIKNGTTTPPPPAMLPYIPGLIGASSGLLQLMEKNPSVQGVSEAFLAVHDLMDESFVSWCSVVGQFFFKEELSKVKSDLDEGTEPLTPGKPASPRPRLASGRNSSTESNLPIVMLEPNKIRRNTKARPSVRDLAILPTQRIMRYVLLFKELHSLTPDTLPFFATVEHALHAAQSIAQKANEAQEHTTTQYPALQPPRSH